MPLKIAQFQLLLLHKYRLVELLLPSQHEPNPDVHVPNASFFLFIGGLDMEYGFLFISHVRFLPVQMLAYIISRRMVLAREILKTLQREVYYQKVQQQIFTCIPYMPGVVLAVRYVIDCFTGLNSSPSSYAQLCHTISQCLSPPWVKCLS